MSDFYTMNLNQLFMEQEKLLTTKDVMNLLGLSYDGVYRLVMNGKIIPVCKQDRKNYFDPAHIHALKAKRESMFSTLNHAI